MKELESFTDPRDHAEFCSRYFPKASAKPVPNSPSDRNEGIIIEFAAAYYRINREYARLVELRLASNSPERRRRERVQMQEIEKALRHRDDLEDYYAPFGVIVEPLMENGYAVDLRCSFGNVDSRGKPRALLITLTASVPVPLPPGAKLADYLIHVEMPELVWSEE